MKYKFRLNNNIIFFTNNFTSDYYGKLLQNYTYYVKMF